MIRVIVCGSRTFSNSDQVDKRLNSLLEELGEFELVTGHCPTGADKLAEDWREWSVKKVPLMTFPAEWLKHGKSAGPRRNRVMCSYAGSEGRCIAFRSAGESRGTDNMIQLARRVGMCIEVIHEEDQ